MKLTKLLSLMSVALALVTSSCTDEPKSEPSTLSVSPQQISFKAEKGSATIKINSNTKWRISGFPSWITVSPSNGENNEVIDVYCDENTDIGDRSGSITVLSSDGSIEETVSVKQSGRAISLSVDVTSIILSSVAQSSQTINIRCNSDWKISGIPEWLQVSSYSGNGNSSIVITSRSSNDSSNTRSAVINITSQTQSVTVKVDQEPGLSSCKAVPSNITTLHYAVVFNMTYSSEVATT